MIAWQTSALDIHTKVRLMNSGIYLEGGGQLDRVGKMLEGHCCDMSAPQRSNALALTWKYTDNFPMHINTRSLLPMSDLGTNQVTKEEDYNVWDDTPETSYQCNQDRRGNGDIRETVGVVQCVTRGYREWGGLVI